MSNPAIQLLDRDSFRNAVFQRDGHACVICGHTKYVRAEHKVRHGGELVRNELASHGGE